VCDCELWEDTLSDFEEAFVCVRVPVRTTHWAISLVAHPNTRFLLPTRTEAINASKWNLALHSQWAFETGEAAALAVECRTVATYALSAYTTGALQLTRVHVVFHAHTRTELTRRRAHGTGRATVHVWAALAPVPAPHCPVGHAAAARAAGMLSARIDCGGCAACFIPCTSGNKSWPLMHACGVALHVAVEVV